MAKVNQSDLTSKVVGLKRDSEWRGQIVAPSSGTAEKPMVFTAYGTGTKPIINAATLITGSWTLVAVAIYSHAFMIKPNRLWWGSEELLYNPGKFASLALGEYDHSIGKLYVNIGIDPTGQVIEAPYYGVAIQVDPRNYVVVDNLHATKANLHGLSASETDTHHNAVSNSEFDKNGLTGMFCGLSTGVNCTFWKIQDSTFDSNGISGQEHGLGLYLEMSSNILVTRNRFTRNFNFGAQVQDLSNDNAITYNYFGNNAHGQFAIWDNGKGLSTGNLVAYNILVGSRLGVVVGGSAGPAINSLLHNTVYDFKESGLQVDNNANFGTVQNNIVWSERAGAKALRDSGTKSVMTSDYNLWGPESVGYMRWRGSLYDTLAAYIAATKQDINSIAGNPLFEDATVGNFTLRLGSPAIGRALFIPGASKSRNMGAIFAVAPQDLNGDGVVNIQDVMLVILAVLGL